MAYPSSVRQEALERRALGESFRSIGKSLGCDPSTVEGWHKMAASADYSAPAREGIASDSAFALVRAVATLKEQLREAGSSPEYLRGTAYAAKCLSDIALDWSEGRKGTTVNIDQSQHLALPAGLTLDELRRIAEGG